MNEMGFADSRKSITALYNGAGFYLAENLLGRSAFACIETIASNIIAQYHPCQNIHAPEIADYLRTHPRIVTNIYDALQNHQSLVDLGKSKALTDIVRLFIPKPALYLKAALRIDLPFASKELAYWHQDDYYVKGNEDELTIWIPLQDTSVPQGCLSIMPGSHRLGRLDHSYTADKRHIPQGIYDREIRLIEMTKGDALFISSLLVHSSNFNFSANIRFSVQLRYTSTDKNPSTIMRGTINV